MLAYFLAGAFVGAATGVPIGVLGVAVIDSAFHRGLQRAVAVGMGGGVGDLVYCGLGVLVLGPVFARDPDVPALLCAISGLVLIAFGAVVARPRPKPVFAPSGDAPSSRVGFWLGLGLVLINPASLVTWVVIVGGLTSSATSAEGACFVIGVGVGSAAWFVSLAHVAHRGAQVLGERTVWIGRIAGTLLVGYGLFSVARGAHYFLR